MCIPICAAWPSFTIVTLFVYVILTVVQSRIQLLSMIDGVRVTLVRMVATLLVTIGITQVGNSTFSVHPLCILHWCKISVFRPLLVLVCAHVQVYFISCTLASNQGYSTACVWINKANNTGWPVLVKTFWAGAKHWILTLKRSTHLLKCCYNILAH